nr:hypothetical protein [Candidatus Sigynarchaeota archaeon]
MPGIFHAIFGLVAGLVIWKLAQDKDGYKPINLGLVFVFAFNNYIGPDLNSIFRGLGDLLGSQGLEDLGRATHSYLGWVIWSIPWSILWYVVLVGIDRAKNKNINAFPDRQHEEILHHGFAHVFLAVLVGGISHHLIDCLGHARLGTGDIYYPTGRFVLVPAFTGDLIGVYGIVSIGCAALIAAYLVVAKRKGVDVRQKIRGFFTTCNLPIPVFLGIALLNVLLMYAIPASAGFIETSNGTILFYLGNLLQATSEYEAGSATWWIAVGTAPTLVLFFLSHAKAWKIKFPKVILHGKFTIRADLLVILAYITFLVTGYALQPVIGGVSGTERDLGILAFSWATLGTIASAFLTIKWYHPVIKQRENEKKMA